MVSGCGGLCDHEDLFDRSQHRNFLPRLLGAAERQGAGPGSPAGGGDHGFALRGAEVRLYLRPAPAEFCGSVRTVRHLGQPDVLGVPVGNALADGSPSLGAKTFARLNLDLDLDEVRVRCFLTLTSLLRRFGEVRGISYASGGGRGVVGSKGRRERIDLDHRSRDAGQTGVGGRENAPGPAVAKTNADARNWVAVLVADAHRDRPG